MKTDRSNQLLNELLGPEDMETLRQATLESGLAGLRRRRARRRLILGCALAFLFIFPISIGVLRHELASRSPRSIPQSPFAASPVDPNTITGTKIISDEELFALFPGRPLALVGTPGHQQLVFLDEVDGPKPKYAR